MGLVWTTDIEIDMGLEEQINRAMITTDVHTAVGRKLYLKGWGGMSKKFLELPAKYSKVAKAVFQKKWGLTHAPSPRAPGSYGTVTTECGFSYI